MRSDQGRRADMSNSDPTPGPLADEKEGPTSEPGHPQPDAAEVESARLLANQARERLAESERSDDELRRLADEYIALDLGEDLDAFVAWVRDRASSP
jgi:hypothetical protein